MGKKLFIAEKPSVAQEFAKALKESMARRNGYLESDHSVVTWCVGHLVTMSYPDKYDEKYKKWSFDTLPFLPERIPAHYDAAGLVTRWGSRFEVLILPPCVILFGFFLRFMANITGDWEGENWKKISLLIGCAGLLVFNVLMIFILYTSFGQVEDISHLFPWS